MNTKLYFLMKRLSDLENEFSALSEDEKEVVIFTTEKTIGSLQNLYEALEDYCIYTFIDDDE